MMPRYRYTLTATTPVSAGESDQRSNMRRAHRILPGATVRGALAAQWWKTHDEAKSGDSRAFSKLFDDVLLVGQAVPSGWELLSASAQVCKYHPLPECADVVHDPAVPGTTLEWTTCWACGGPLVTAAGWRSGAGPSIQVVPRTRGELTARETAAQGQLFTRQAVAGSAGPAVFTGVLSAPDGAWLDGVTVRVGGGRSLDLGASHLAVEEMPWPALPPGDVILLRVTSPAILLDEFGGSDVSLAGLTDELRRVSGEAGLTVSGSAEWLRTVPVSGWHMRSRLPKPVDWALAPGSVALIEGLTSIGWDRLQNGIGVRTLEGYGQVEAVGSDDLPTPPENDGVRRLRTLRGLVKRPKDWAALKRSLQGTLEQMRAAEPDRLATIRAAATFPGLLGEAKTTVKSVLDIPPGHIPGTIAKLKEMR